MSIGQLIQAELAPIGISVEIKQLELNVLLSRAGTGGEPFDIVQPVGWFADYPDPFDFLNLFFDGRSIKATGNLNYAYFNDPVTTAGPPPPHCSPAPAATSPTKRSTPTSRATRRRVLRSSTRASRTSSPPASAARSSSPSTASSSQHSASSIAASLQT
jgi:ABC-type oligopeptide transport system substrate-binding subunit